MAETDYIEPLPEDIHERMWEKFTIGAEYRNHDLIDVSIGMRMCLVCLKMQMFATSHERDSQGNEYLYKYCIGGKHHTIREAVRNRR